MGKEYINEIDGILGRSKRREDKKVAANLLAFLKKNDSMLNRAHALAMVRLAAKYQFDLTSAIPLSKVMDLFDWQRLQRTSHKAYTEKPLWEAYMLSQVLYGLRMFNDKTEGLNAYLDYLANALEETEYAGKKMNNQEVANSLYGLAGLDATTVERIIERVISLGPDRIQTATNTFGAGGRCAR